MAGIFISYRRADSQALAGRLFDRLTQRFGKDQVFRDIDAINPGANFAEVIGERIGGCGVLVALIGKEWVDIKDAEGHRRFDLPHDIVRAELAAALVQGKLVIPALIEDTPMPRREELPAEIAALADLNALPISDSRFHFDVGRLISAIEKALCVGTPAIASKDLWTLIHDMLRKRFGAAGLVVLACGGIWWQWDHIIKLPGIEFLVTRMTQKALPKAVPGKFNIGLVHLEADKNHETERLIRESLAEFSSVATLSFDRLIAPEHSSTEEAEREGHRRARALLKASGGDVLIWGVILRQGDKSLPKLYWTPAREETKQTLAGRYQINENEAFRLPIIFWHDLTKVLGLLVATSAADSENQEGQYTADKLESFIRQGRELLQDSQVAQWNADRRMQVQSIFAGALKTYSEQSGKNEPLREAVALYLEVLKGSTREKAPLGWAVTQNSLGNALRILGQRESDPARLMDAVATFRAALTERTREKVPLDWAKTQNNLGTALVSLGGRDPDLTRLTDAVAAFRQALKEFTRDKFPHAWAITQNNLGTALLRLAERETDSDPLTAAITAYREALLELKREKVPLDWAMTQSNLCNALSLLGDRHSDPERLSEAVTACREALNEFTREKVPLDWAMAQNNLGNALSALGELESDPARLAEAITAYREALKERTREKVPLDWAMTQSNLGNALTAMVERRWNLGQLTEAVDAFRDALKEYSRERAPLQWALIQSGLGNALWLRGERESDLARLKEAAKNYEAALIVFREAKSEDYIRFIEERLQRIQTSTQ